jgi:hypothetical protein
MVFSAKMTLLALTASFWAWRSAARRCARFGMFRDFPYENTNGPRRVKPRPSRFKVSKAAERAELDEDFELQEMEISDLEC